MFTGGSCYKKRSNANCVNGGQRKIRNYESGKHQVFIILYKKPYKYKYYY